MPCVSRTKREYRTGEMPVADSSCCLNERWRGVVRGDGSGSAGRFICSFRTSMRSLRVGRGWLTEFPPCWRWRMRLSGARRWRVGTSHCWWHCLCLVSRVWCRGGWWVGAGGWANTRHRDGPAMANRASHPIDADLERSLFDGFPCGGMWETVWEMEEGWRGNATVY